MTRGLIQKGDIDTDSFDPWENTRQVRMFAKVWHDYEDETWR